MLYYYIFTVSVALVFYALLLLIKKKIPETPPLLCLYVVLWALILSFSLPTMLSILTPGYSMSLIFILFLLGGFLIIHRVSVSKIVEVDGSISTFIPSGMEDVPEQASKAEAAAAREDAAFREAEEKAAPEAEAAVKGTEAAAFLKKFSATPLLIKESKHFESDKGVLLLQQKELSYNELFESAFQAREEGNYESAIDNLRSSLDGITDIFLKGLIYTELVFLYKETGKYLEASGMIQSFVSENGAALAPSLVRHFTSLVNYLQTIDQLLKKAEQPEMPYSQVPRLIKLRAEKLLKE